MAKKLNIEEATKSLALLAQEFPECFTLAAPQPLKVNIKKDIVEHWGDTPKFSKTKLQQALYFYTNSAAYLNAFKMEPVRVDLHGNPVEDVLESDRDHSFKKYLAKYKKKGPGKPRGSFSPRGERPQFSDTGPVGFEKSAAPFSVSSPMKDISKVEIIKKPSRRKSSLLTRTPLKK